MEAIVLKSQLVIFFTKSQKNKTSFEYPGLPPKKLSVELFLYSVCINGKENPSKNCTFKGKFAVIDLSNVSEDVSDVSNLSRPGSEILKRDLIGRILDIKEAPSGLQLTTDMKNATDITVTQDAFLSFLIRKPGTPGYSERTPATLGDLAIGQRIRIGLAYSPKTGTWYVKNVSIIKSI